jgi:hypothetical protein
VLSHTGAGGSTVSSRVSASGYPWTASGENLAVRTGLGLDAAAADTLQRMLFVDAGVSGRGHRVNMLRGSYEDVGVGLTSGQYQGLSATYGGSDFGAKAGDAAITGVAYTDAVAADRFYTPGEGIGGVSVVARGAAGTFRTTTAAAGGYALAVPAGTYDVTFTAPDGRSATHTVAIGAANVKLDYVPSDPAPAAPAPKAATPAPAAAAPAPGRVIAVGADAGGAAAVELLDAATGRVAASVPSGDTLPVGARVATADVNGDGVSDLIIGTGPGTVARVRVVDGRTQQDLFSLQPFDGFDGGVYVAAGDVTGDGRADVVITPDVGGGPRVKVLSGRDFTTVADFMGIGDPNFRGGVRPAVGDVNGDRVADIVVSAGFGGGPRVAGFDGRGLRPDGSGPRLFADFFAFSDSLRNGAFVALGDVDGDGKADLIAGAGPDGGPRVTVYGGAQLLANGQTPLADFFAGNPSNRGGIRVAAEDLDGDGRADLVVGSGPAADGTGSRVTAYPARTLAGNGPPAAFAVDAFPGYAGGVFVG